MMAVLAGTSYEATAETYRPCQVAYVRRGDFLRFIADHPEAYPGIVKQLSSSYARACEQLRNVASSASAQERVGRLLLEWSKETKWGNQITLPLTQEEIGELIGVSRETVTRALSQLRDHRLIVRKGVTLTIPDRAALASFVTDCRW